MVRNNSSFLALPALAAALAGCSGGSGNGAAMTPQAQPRKSIQNEFQVKWPALVAFDNNSNTLEYWPIQQGGGTNPIAIASNLGINAADALAADRNYLAIASISPSNLITYNLGSKKEMAYPDPGGPPVDLAMAKGDTVYVLNTNNVEGFPLDRLYPRTIDCPYITNGVSIAIDNQGDLFVNGYGPGSFVGVVEYPYGDWNCTPLDLKPEQGIIGGVGIDPSTDDLIVVDNPNSCAGSGDGRMTIYPPPYTSKSATQVSLNATYCAGTFRLDAVSENIFVMDAAGSQSQIDELSYPEGQSEGVYSGGLPGGFTTMPNTLPN